MTGRQTAGGVRPKYGGGTTDKSSNDNKGNTSDTCRRCSKMVRDGYGNAMW